MDKELILPGIMRFPNALEVPEGIVERLISAKSANKEVDLSSGPERYNADGDTLFRDFPDCRKYYEYVQSVWKEALCHYIEVYDEVVYNLFWQESTQLICYGPGLGLGWHSDTMATRDEDGRTEALPHKRYLTCIAYINDDYVGGELEFKYWDLKHKPTAGEVMIYPSNFLYAHRSTPLLSGKKLAFLVSFCTGEMSDIRNGQGYMLT